MPQADANHTQRSYARLAGVLLIGAIVVALGASAVLSKIAGTGIDPETAARIAVSPHLYRLALSSVLIVTLSSTLLAFALYVTLKPVDSLLAQLGMIFSLGDSFLALIVRMCGFVRLHLSLSAGAAAAEPLSELLRTIAATTENIAGILFGIGSGIFFVLFFQSRYLPRAISALGLVASVIWTALYFAGLIFPEQHSLFQSVCFPPMVLAEVATGIYLMLFAVRAEPPPTASAAMI